MRLCFFAPPNALHTRRIAAALMDRGHRVHVVHKGPAELDWTSHEMFGVPAFGPKYPQRRIVRRRRYLERFFRQHDVVAVHFLGNWGLSPEVIEQGCLAVTPWGSDVCPPPGAPVLSARSFHLRMIMLRHAHGISAFSDWFGRQIAEYASIEHQCVETVPLAVDLDLFRPRPAPTGPPVVGFFKGFGTPYGAEHFVRAMPAIVDEVADVRFEMIGGGATLEQCRMLATELGVSNRIRWRPPVPAEQVPAVIARWRVTVIPSVRESLGVAALESSAMRVPVVASRVGGLPEAVIDGETGLLVWPEDSPSIADAVVALLVDNDLHARMAEAGRCFVESRYDWKQVGDRWVQFYAAALERSRSTWSRSATPVTDAIETPVEVGVS